MTTGRAWAALVALAVPLFALSVDLNGVAVLLPDLARDLGVTPITASAVVTAAALGSAAPVLLVGRIADRFGAKALLVGGVGAFAVSSGICAAADSFAVLMVGRGLQGLATACCFTTSLVAVDALFDARRRPVAIGLWAAIGGLGGALGPLVASGLASLWSWRALFAVNVGLGAVSCVALARLVPTLPGDATRRVQPVRLATLALGLALAMGGLQAASDNGWDPVTTVLPMVLGAALVAGALRAASAGPLVRGAVAKVASFRSGTWAATTSNWGSAVALVLVPAALAAARGLDVLETGVVLLSFSALFALGSAASGPLLRACGARTAMLVGSLGQAAGLAVLAAVGLDAPIGGVVFALALSGAGNGAVYSAATSAALAEIAPGDAGEASGLLTMLRLFGLTVGVAVSGALVSAVDADLGLASADGMRVALVVGAVVTASGALLAGGRSPAPTARAAAH